MTILWHIHMLGALRAEHGELRITRFATSRTAALLACLALFPRREHSREELVKMLWPDSEWEAGRLNLRVALASLRRQLEPPDVPAGSVLKADRETIRLEAAACRTDVADFEAALKIAARTADPLKKRLALDEALGLFGGELLPGFYNEWILEERERLEALLEDAEQQRDSLPPATSISLTPPKVAPSPNPALRGFPFQFTRGFGHEKECMEVAALLREAHTRLVTLTGPGGAGKTRLAGNVARAVQNDFAGPIYFVPVADLTDASFLPEAIAAGMGLTRTAEMEPLDQIVAALSAQPPTLLVLDNLEHLMERGSLVVLSLLTRLPALTCLVTSRRRLRLPGEREYPLPPLAVPQEGGTPEQVMGLSGVALFVDRAQATRPDFQLTRGNVGAVSDLCRNLEGLPLAIELVAARAMSLTPAQMNEKLAQRFALLTSQRGDKGTRHRSLWAAITWSYDLLSPRLKRFFVELSVFRGGFTAELAQEVCEESEALEFLAQLRERSLLVAEEHRSEMRFRLLESLRVFGEEHLPAEERSVLSRRHAASFAALAAQMGTLWSGPSQARALEILDAETDNFRAALAFCAADSEAGSGETGLRLAGALGPYWTTRGQLREGIGWLKDALSQEGSAAARAKALAEYAWLEAGTGEHSVAENALTEAIALCRTVDDPAMLASTLRKRGVVALWRSDNAVASVHLKEALALSRTLGDLPAIAASLNSLGVLADQWQEDKAVARAYYEEALGLFRKCGDERWQSYCLHNLGNIAEAVGDNDLAETLLRESLALAEALGDPWHRAYCLRSLGDVFKARGEFPEAIRLLNEGRALCQSLGDRMSEAGIVCSLAMIARRQDAPALAESLSCTALVLYRDMQHSSGVALCLLELTEIAADLGRWERVAALLAAQQSACADATLADDTRTRFAAAAQSARVALGSDRFHAAQEQGKCLTLDDCAAYALTDDLLLRQHGH
jgi:predicted ATPase